MLPDEIGFRFLVKIVDFVPQIFARSLFFPSMMTTIGVSGFNDAQRRFSNDNIFKSFLTVFLTVFNSFFAKF